MGRVVVRSADDLAAAIVKALASVNDSDIVAGSKAETGVSVIMRIYNSSKHVAEALASIVNQDYEGQIGQGG